MTLGLGGAETAPGEACDLLAEARLAPGVMVDRLALALDAVGAGVFEINVEKKAFWCSEGLVRMLGRRLTMDELMSPVWPVHHPDDRERVAEAVATARAGRIDAHFESRVVLPDGSTRWFDWRLRVKRDAAGAFDGVIGVTLDIDQRKRQEVALEEARREAESNAQRLKLAMLAAGSGVFEVDFGKRQHWCSPEYEQIVGRKMAYEDIAAPVWAFTHPDDKERVLEHIRSARNNILVPAEWRVVLPSGEIRWVQTNGFVHRSEDGVSRRVVGYIQDIDQRKRQDLALEEAQASQQQAVQRLDVALTGADAGVFEVDFRNRSFWCSSTFVDIVGRPLTFEESCAVWPMCHPDDAERVEAAVRSPRADGEMGQVDYRVILPSGEARWIDGRTAVHRDETGAVVKVFGLVLAADERKRQELALIEAERAASAGAEAKSQFLANMSHEIRTPMNGVL